MKKILSIPGSTVLRVGIALVVIWFGTEQLMHTEMWVGFLPQWIIDLSPIGVTTLVHLNGAMEIFFGTCLILGLFTRISALILAGHLAHITYTMGYNSIGIRDFGLMVGALAIFLDGADAFTLDNRFLLGPKEPPLLPGQETPFVYTPRVTPPATPHGTGRMTYIPGRFESVE